MLIVILQLKTILSRTEMSVANLNVTGNLTFNSNIEMKNVDAVGGGKITGDIDIDNDFFVYPEFLYLEILYYYQK